MKKLTKKQIETITNDLYKKLGDRVQVNIMHLGRILNPVQDELKANNDILKASELMEKLISQYRLN